jgi:hypothetical protein
MRPDQDDLVAPVAWSLADAYTVPDIAWPRLIYDGGQLVGTTHASTARKASTGAWASSPQVNTTKAKR